MTFKVGDKVKFLNDVGGGIVKKIRQQTAYVETEDGFEMPASFSELIKVEETGFGQFTPEPVVSRANPSVKATAPAEEENDTEDYAESTSWQDDENDEIITTENSTLNVILGIVPTKAKGAQENGFDIYLISDCAYRLMYTFSVVKDNFVHGKRAGLVEEDTKVLVASFSMAELKVLQSFKINCIFYKKGVYLPHEPLIYEYKIDALTLANPLEWEENDYFERKAVIVNITEMSLIYEIERMITETDDKYIIQKKRPDTLPSKHVQSKKQQSEIEEVDLHIEELIDSHSGMEAGEILNLQMSRFIIALDGAIRNKTRKIVFIHGVGNGKLKQEIRKTLDTKYSKLRYQDASFKEYGYGATLVIIK
jgi:hypothetical protein